MTNLIEILQKILNTILDQILTFVPKLITAIIILLVGYLISKLVATVVKKVLLKIKFDKLGEKLNEIGIVKEMKIEIMLSSIISQVLFFFIFIVFISASTEQLGVAALISLVATLVNFIPQLIASALMLMIGVIVAEAIKNVVITICKSFNVPSGKLIGNVVFYFFLIITIVSVLGQAGINTTLLESSFNLIIGGVCVAFGVGYGLASRDILANILSSFYSKNKYTLGQNIRIDGAEGEIVEIDSISMTLKTQDGVVVLPLKLLQSKKVEILKQT